MNRYATVLTVRPIHIIGVPLDLGGNRRGVDMGPSAFRIAGLGERLTALGMTVVDEGDLVAPIPEIKAAGDPQKKYIREIARGLRAALQDVRSRLLDKGGVPARARRRPQPRGRVGRGHRGLRAPQAAGGSAPSGSTRTAT